MSEEFLDRLIVGGARVTEGGRLDFPDRLPFCPSESCGYYDCIFHKLYLYLKGSGRYGEEETLAIRECGDEPRPIVFEFFPSLYSSLDEYKEKYYKENLLPLILRFYEPKFTEEIWQRVKNKE